ncbi:hypothetical protein ONZ45_g7966 [Pleurotus djamor]|nr:hypothetical protein ONZ45_g7966 [Pleurotus djamor]
MHDHLTRLSLQNEAAALGSQKLQQYADNLLRTAPTSFGHGLNSPSRSSFLETPVGLAAIVVYRVVQEVPGFEAHWAPSAQIIKDAVRLVANEDQKSSLLDADGCEVLYGRAGLLYALLSIRAAVEQKETLSGHATTGPCSEARKFTSDENINIIVGSIILRGELGSKEYASSVPALSTDAPKPPPLMWEWHRKRYLGAAHGIAGILHVLLLVPTQLLVPHYEKILQAVEWLLELQDISGNWPTAAPDLDEPFLRSNTSELIQWCHGAPGVILLLSTLIHRSTLNPTTFHLSEDLARKTIVSLSHAASLVYRHGVLKKGVGLCHGIAGSVYALLGTASALERISKTHRIHVASLSFSADGHIGGTGMDRDAQLHKQYLARAVHLAQIATTYEELTASGQMKVPDRPLSLYEGLAGMCCAWGDILAVIERYQNREDGPIFDSDMRSNTPGFDDIMLSDSW